MSKPINPRLPPWATNDAPVTLRDLFAAAALSGVTASGGWGIGTRPEHEIAAAFAYARADAMIAERERGE